MTRTFRLIGLVALAMFAVSAVAATAAGAFEFTTVNPETEKQEGGTIKGKEVEVPYVFTVTKGLSVTCETATFESTSSSGKETEPTITPAFGGCHSIIGGKTFKTDVSTNGCTYRHAITGELEEEGSWEGTTDVVCRPGKRSN